MKILISGKGGSGKSTLSALLAKALKDRGFSVLLVDADESNYGLHRLLGISFPMPLLEHMGGKPGFRKMTSVTFPQPAAALPFKDGMRVDEFPEVCLAESDGVKLLVVGKIHDFGEGCACPMGALSKMFLSKLALAENEIVLIDAAAGVEHFGRRVDGDCDMIVGVVDPTFESFSLAKQMNGMAERAGVKIRFVLNKIDESIRDTVYKNIDANKVAAEIPYLQTLFLDNLAGEKLKTSCREIEPVCRMIEDAKKVPRQFKIRNTLPGSSFENSL